LELTLLASVSLLCSVDDPIARELVERPFELGDERAQGAVVFAQNVEARTSSGSVVLVKIV